MKAIISSTHDDKYLFFLPIVFWAWNKIDIDVICFMPNNLISFNNKKYTLLCDTIINSCNINNIRIGFNAPQQKEATYSQCARLYAAALDLPEDEILITSDCDMIVFGDYIKQKLAGIDLFGTDLVPQGQLPICYISASVKSWRKAMDINGRSYQQCLDNLVGIIECDHFKGNQWSLDQDTAYKQIIVKNPQQTYQHFRARPGTQFASRRYDRDDAYLLERLNPDTIDYHLPRPGYEENNFKQIITVLKYHYPEENFEWLIKYKEEYVKLIEND